MAPSGYTTNLTMFYAWDHLVSRDSQFAIAWRLATNTRVKTIHRSAILKLKVMDLCNSILKNIPRGVYNRKEISEKFSLYLLGQLFYGTVLVHQKQLKYLEEDTIELVRKVKHFSAETRLEITFSSLERAEREDAEELMNPKKKFKRGKKAIDLLDSTIAIPTLDGIDHAVAVARLEDITLHEPETREWHEKSLFGDDDELPAMRPEFVPQYFDFELTQPEARSSDNSRDNTKDAIARANQDQQEVIERGGVLDMPMELEKTDRDELIGMGGINQMNTFDEQFANTLLNGVDNFDLTNPNGQYIGLGAPGEELNMDGLNGNEAAIENNNKTVDQPMAQLNDEEQQMDGRQMRDNLEEELEQQLNISTLRFGEIADIGQQEQGVDEQREQRKRGTKRHLQIDEEIQLTNDMIKENVMDYKDTYRTIEDIRPTTTATFHPRRFRFHAYEALDALFNCRPLAVSKFAPELSECFPTAQDLFDSPDLDLPEDESAQLSRMGGDLDVDDMRLDALDEVTMRELAPMARCEAILGSEANSVDLRERAERDLREIEEETAKRNESVAFDEQMFSLLKDPSLLPPPQMDELEERDRERNEEGEQRNRQMENEMEMMDLQMMNNNQQQMMMQDDELEMERVRRFSTLEHPFKIASGRPSSVLELGREDSRMRDTTLENTLRDKEKDPSILHNLAAVSSVGNSLFFSQLAPVDTTDKRSAARRFALILEGMKSGQIEHVIQDQPMGDIEIILPITV